MKIIINGEETNIDLEVLNKIVGYECFVDGDCGRATECVEIDPPVDHLEGHFNFGIKNGI